LKIKMGWKYPKTSKEGWRIQILVTFEDKNGLEVPKNLKGRLAYSDFGNF